MRDMVAPQPRTTEFAAVGCSGFLCTKLVARKYQYYEPCGAIPAPERFQSFVRRPEIVERPF